MTVPELTTHSTGARQLVRPGLGLLVAALLLCVVELWLHSDAFLLRFRSVFAAGRAMDKVVYVEETRPHLLILGNSRADNGFDPRTVQRTMGLNAVREAFNMGLPGADMRVLAGIVDRLDRVGSFCPGGIRHVVLSLDESLLQAVDTLGQELFFVGPATHWDEGQYRDALRAAFRLYGYTDNLRQLREPAVLKRFAQALHGDVEPVGGGAAKHLGYRAGFGGLQDVQSARVQEAGSLAPPSEANVKQLWRVLDLLAIRGVRVAVVFPPLLNRNVLYLSPARAEAAPYLAIASELRRRGIPLIALDAGPPNDPAEFVNAGHLNDRGAQRYSSLLGEALRKRWSPDSAAASSLKALGS
jgi:hypothetical protein